MDAPADRGRRLYDWWGRHAGWYAVVDRLSRSLRRRAVDELELAPGETVLDLGCGPGGSLALLADRVAPGGRVVALDYSAAMVRRARERARRQGLAVEVVRADAARLPLRPGSVDAAFASLSLSAMPAAERAVDAVATALAPDGRFAVLDGTVPDWPLAGVVRRLYARAANWQGNDVRGLVEGAFADVERVATFDAGAGYLLLASAEGA
jgi:demethylmenaquinone methyltransferase/2-methoxy-6-polyprenyl-1,4-benzoquinol methylase